MNKELKFININRGCDLDDDDIEAINLYNNHAYAKESKRIKRNRRKEDYISVFYMTMSVVVAMIVCIITTIYIKVDLNTEEEFIYYTCTPIEDCSMYFVTDSGSVLFVKENHDMLRGDKAIIKVASMGTYDKSDDVIVSVERSN